MIQNLYVPYRMRVAKVTPEAPSVVTFRLEFVDPADAERFDFKAGQFGEYSVYGEGESTFCIASAPTRKGYIECTFRQAGRVTTALADRDEGDIIGFRGPYGTSYPVDKWAGKNLIFIGGGIAMPPIRCAIWYALENRRDFHVTNDRPFENSASKPLAPIFHFLTFYQPDLQKCVPSKKEEIKLLS